MMSRGSPLDQGTVRALWARSSSNLWEGLFGISEISSLVMASECIKVLGIPQTLKL